jgi:hypothetical protein
LFLFHVHPVHFAVLHAIVAMCSMNEYPFDYSHGRVYLMIGIMTIFQLYRGGQFYSWRKPDYL